MAEMIITRKNGDIYTVLYDDEDKELIEKYKWYVTEKGYCQGRKIGFKSKNISTISMHRLVMNADDSNIMVDHINRVPFDNRKINLRFCTNAQNQMNRKPKGKSKYLGVSFYKNKKGYICIESRIRINGKPIKIGLFKTEEEGARAYDKMAKIHHGEFAYLNFPNE